MRRVTGRREPAKVVLQFRDVPIDNTLQPGRGLDVFKFNLSRRFHARLH